MPSVSVVIPCGNRPGDVLAALAGAHRQTARDGVEVILVEDGTTPGADRAAILNALGPVDRCILAGRERPAIWNAGFASRAGGYYVEFSCAKDWEFRPCASSEKQWGR